MECIVEIAKRIVPPELLGASVGKVGSRHFALLIPVIESSLENFKDILRDILVTASHPLLISGQTIRPLFRSGLSFWPQDGRTYEEVHHHAEIALNQAIGSEAREPVIYQCDLKQRHTERLALVDALHRSVERNELRIFYQPQIELKNGCFDKAEALLRWDHPDQGLLTPDRFIRIAEEVGLIEVITNWVIRQVSLDIPVLRSRIHPDFTVSINISPSYVSEYMTKSKGFLDHILRQNLPMGSVVFEITEDTVLQPGTETLYALESLKAHGFKIAIDDFGVGYSCLSYLQKLPVDIIKIDKLFVDPFLSSMEGFGLCKAVIHLAMDLGKLVVVEGLQTRHQVDLVNAAGAHYGQGFIFSAPLPVGQLLIFRQA
jgi:EAL domain-containing protein (putative c-di-GMP-specific phosphodiesterase class I)